MGPGWISNEHESKRQRFAAAAPLEFLSIDIKRPLPKVPLAGDKMIIMTDGYPHLICAIPTG